MAEYPRFDPSSQFKYESPIFVRVRFRKKFGGEDYKYVFGTFRGETDHPETYRVHIDTALLRDVEYEAKKEINDGQIAVFHLHKEDIYLDDERTELKPEYQ